MKKFLYITDQDEYTDHSFIGPLFKKYLKEFYEIDIVYFSDFKDETQFKDDRYVVPSHSKERVLEELEQYGVNISEYEYVVIRNTGDLLQPILNKRDAYGYKVVYRFSFPKRRAKIAFSNSVGFFETLKSNMKTYSETNLINQCDLFMPASKSLHEDYFADVNIKQFILPPAIDPDVLHPNVHHEGNEKRFFFAGALDKIREFDTVLEAFGNIKADGFKLMLATEEEEYAKELIAKYPNLRLGKNVDFFVATTKEELLALIAQADIGISLLPNNPIFNTSTPVKVLNYYSSAVPCIMTDNADNSQIFTDDYDAWFCKFTSKSIQERVEDILALSKEEITDIGIKGQNRLLEIRNYKTIAKKVYTTFEAL